MPNSLKPQISDCTLLKTWIPFILFGVLWIDLISLLSTQWEAREQYGYGWFVPFFAAALFWRRWLDRPGANRENRNRIAGIGKENDPVSGEKPNSKNQEAEMGKNLRPLTSGSSVSCSSSFGRDVRAGVVQSPISYLTSAKFQLTAFALPALCFLLCVLLLPLRVVYEINTDWPLISWSYTLIVVVLTLYAFQLADPHPLVRSPQSVVRDPWPVVSPWVRHCAFPVCFILVAVVWPYRIENGLTQGLMRVVASLTVELLGWFDIPAMQRGNLIELGTGTVGVDEACSGIRSFQSSLMAALLMGELYRFRLLPRAALVLCGLSLGFCFNVVRTLILSWQANANGLEAISKWHDPAGMTITVACFFSLWGLAVLMTKRWSRGEKVKSRKQKAATASQDQAWVAVLIPQTSPEVGSPMSAVGGQWSVFSSPQAFMFAVGLWSILCIAGTQAWYWFHSRNSGATLRWSVALPVQKAAFKAIELPPRSVQLLRYDSGATGSWAEDDGSEWTLFFLRWNPTSATSIFRARQHRPDVCLPAAGMTLVKDAGREQFQVRNLALPFRKYIYQSAGKPLYVFFCQWEDGAKRQSGLADSEQGGRIQASWNGRKSLGQQSLEVILSGYESLGEAEQALRRKLPGLIRIAKPGQSATASGRTPSPIASKH